MASQSAAEIATAPACAPAAVGLGGSSEPGSVEEVETKTEVGVNKAGVTDGREPKQVQEATARTLVQRLSRRLSERKQQLQVEMQQLVHRRQQRLGKYRFVRGASGGSEAEEKEVEAATLAEGRPASGGTFPPPATASATTVVTRRMAAHAKTKPAVRSEHNLMRSRYKLVRRMESPPNAEPQPEH